MVAEIAIVGGGPSGLALAGILEKRGIDYVVYERDAKDNRPAGGCLDLHKGSGQRAFREAGCFDEMRKFGRLGDATIATVVDHHLNKSFAWGEGRDAPELDRFEIRKALLTVVPDHKVKWETRIKSSSRDEKGQVVLHFEDGTTASGFKLVVGADGTWSKLRHLITPVRPQYAGQIFLTGFIDHQNPHYNTMKEKAGAGPLVILGRSTVIWIQQQGDGHYRMDFGFVGPDDFGKNGAVDLQDEESVRNILLDDHFFGHHGAEVKDIIKATKGPFRAWPMWYFPTEHLNWKSAQGVTLIGDAAHTTTPFVGDGVNCALRDSIMLADQLKELGPTQEAIEAYEKQMFPFAIDVIDRSLISGKLFFHWKSPQAFLDFISHTPLIGGTDDF